MSKKIKKRYRETVGAMNYGFILYYGENFGVSYTVEDALTLILDFAFIILYH